MKNCDVEQCVLHGVTCNGYLWFVAETETISDYRYSEALRRFVEMEIKGKVHCLFEQSGTFKNEFKKLGYKAYDYDIQDNFGETDYVIDLFSEIDNAYKGGQSIFDGITTDDLIIAFYPCIYFCAWSQIAFYLSCRNYRRLDTGQKIERILERSDNRKEYFDRLIKFVAVCLKKNIRMIFENPWSEQTYLKANFLKKPDVVDMNRMERGDYFKKPTAYWFWNCEPTSGFTRQNDKEQKTIEKSRQGARAGLCSEERSMISPDYARNWICDFVLGKTQGNLIQEKSMQKTLF